MCPLDAVRKREASLAQATNNAGDHRRRRTEEVAASHMHHQPPHVRQFLVPLHVGSTSSLVVVPRAVVLDGDSESRPGEIGVGHIAVSQQHGLIEHGLWDAGCADQQAEERLRT